MKLTKREFLVLGQTAYGALVTIGFSYLIGFATKAEILLIAAAPLGMIVVGLLAWLPARAQLLTWASVTAWLLSAVYLGTSDFEYLMLVGVFLAAIAGVFWSPWFLAAIWFIHPLWDLIPRDLPDHQHDLPLACLIYDLIIAIYLAWRIRNGFFAGATAAPSVQTGVLKTGFRRSLAALAMLMVVVAEIMIVGTLSMNQFSIFIAVPVALALIASTLWLPIEGKKAFWLVFTIWTGMTFAHSGELLEILIFGLMILLAVAGYRVSMNYWVIAWGFHALWHLFPREHISHDAAMLMGHWMVSAAGLLFELVIAGYLFWFTRRNTYTSGY